MRGLVFKNTRQCSSYAYGTMRETLRIYRSSNVSNPMNQSLVEIRSLSSISRYDLLAGSLSHQDAYQRRPKIVLDAYSSTGFDVLNLLHLPHSSGANGGDGLTQTSSNQTKEQDVHNDNDDVRNSTNSVHMKGSIIVFPYSCFLWNVTSNVTLESLAVVALHKPPIQYLFIGSEIPLVNTEFIKIQKYFKLQFNIIVERMDVVCFNILS